MSINEWKILNQIKCYVSKFNERVIHKELAEVLQKIPSLGGGQSFRYFDYGIGQQQSAEGVVQQKKIEKTSYNLPNVLDNLKIGNQNKNEAVPETSIKWKAPNSIVSKVRFDFLACS